MKITLLLIAMNVIAFLYATYYVPDYIKLYGVSPDSFARGNYANIITAMFVHVNILHLALNMSLLFFLGKEIESEAGGLAYLLIYFASGLIANLGVLLLPLVGINATLAGASAAISGLVGYGAFKLSGRWVFAPLTFIPLPLPFIAAGAMYFVVNFTGLLLFDLPSIGHMVGGLIGAGAGLVGEESKIKKLFIFFVLIGLISAFISLALPYLLSYLKDLASPYLVKYGIEWNYSTT